MAQLMRDIAWETMSTVVGQENQRSTDPGNTPEITGFGNLNLSLLRLLSQATTSIVVYRGQITFLPGENPFWYIILSLSIIFSRYDFKLNLLGGSESRLSLSFHSLKY